MSPRSRHLRPGAFALALPLIAISLALTGCTPTVALDAADQAEDPSCAAVIVRLPETVASQAKRETNAQGTGAWGNPTSVILHCGVVSPGPTTDRCLSINGIDWVEVDVSPPRYTYVTYGRTPAVEVTVDNTAADASSVLPDLTDAVAVIPAGRACVGPEEVPLPADDGSVPTPAATP